MKDNCFTEFCCFLSNCNMNEPEVYICSLPPPPLPTSLGWYRAPVWVPEPCWMAWLWRSDRCSASVTYVTRPHSFWARPWGGSPTRCPRAAGAGTCLLFRGPRERPVFANPFTIAKIEESLPESLCISRVVSDGEPAREMGQRFCQKGVCCSVWQDSGLPGRLS